MGMFWSAEVVLMGSLEVGGVVELVTVDLPQDVAWRQATALAFNPAVSPAQSRAMRHVISRHSTHVTNQFFYFCRCCKVLVPGILKQF
jgi:hypothetical protein